MKRGNKKAQISVFIIIGIFIIAGAGGAVYWNKVQTNAKLNKEYFASEEIQPQIENIQMNVVYCMQSVSQESLKIIGLQGGYYEKPEKYLDIGWIFIPYYYFKGEYLMPLKADIENELKNYVNDNLKLCLNELEFDKFKLSNKNIKSKIVIKPGEVFFDIDGDFIIQRDERKMTLDLKDNPVVQVSKLFEVLEVAEYMTESHKEDASMYCINCVAEMAEERDLYVITNKLNNNELLVIIGENVTSYKPYLFNFLNKYTGEEVSPDFDLGKDGYVSPEVIK